MKRSKESEAATGTVLCCADYHEDNCHFRKGEKYKYHQHSKTRYTIHTTPLNIIITTKMFKQYFCDIENVTTMFGSFDDNYPNACECLKKGKGAAVSCSKCGGTGLIDPTKTIYGTPFRSKPNE